MVTALSGKQLADAYKAHGRSHRHDLTRIAKRAIRMISTAVSTLLLGTIYAGAAFIRPLEPRWATDAVCKSFYADITASASNIDLASVFGAA